MKSIVVVVAVSLLLSCSSSEKYPVSKFLSDTPIVPLPRSMTSDSSYLLMDKKVTVSYEGINAEGLGKLIENEWPIKSGEASTRVLLRKNALDREAYELTIDPQLITIEASDATGLLWGWRSLQQIIQLNADTLTHTVALPTGKIIDQPRFPYRGMMLDIARHFFNPEEIKTVIDEISMYKINYLHLHLADDQGWRIEIKSWPQLTEIGGSVEVGSSLEVEQRQGGWLTQAEYRELVSYAQERGITIVPEIDMPGHTNAALASYPELNCDGIARELYTGTKVGFSSLCVDKEITYQFIGDVVKEIAEMTPGPYFHIGGDESHVTDHDDYIYFINRVKSIVDSHGKFMIGWDEIAEANVDSTSVVQFWAHEKMASLAVEKSSKLLFSPANKAYLDMKYDSTTTLGLMWAGLIDLPTSYQWDPSDYLSTEQVHQVIGLEAPLWSETVTNIDEVEYMMFPRLGSYAEIGWSAPEQRDYHSFSERLGAHYVWWSSQGINAAKRMK